ncbi:hypothetical protein FRB94_007356 [Tulasnella sp. JGI-2019a]|nr:hypothetical protein FRB94_007356 [Tulasnella sp. JGI-2019a]KAG9039741.1 hypothetical protein FRB95_007168 [Tulasnella sp. JGI-2019a]
MVDYQEALQQETQRLSAELPTTEDVPSCWKLFDTFFNCQIAVSQVKSLYRYGHRSECSQKWEDVKFCLSNKTLSEDERRAAWIQHRAEWWARRRVERSSEDVWDIRTRPLENYPPPSASHSIIEEEDEVKPSIV